MQPGQTISPGSQPENPNWQFRPESNPPASQPAAPEPVAPTPATTQAPQPSPAPPAAASGQTGVSWTASEFIAHNKPSGWYGMLALGSFVIAAAVYFLTRDKISTGVIILVAIIFGFSAAHEPRELQYRIDDKAVYIGDRSYSFNSFRSFSVVQEEGIESIWLMPLKRFRPVVSIYFDPNDADKIFNLLSQSLPVEKRQLDNFDRLMHLIRF